MGKHRRPRRVSWGRIGSGHRQVVYGTLRRELQTCLCRAADRTGWTEEGQRLYMCDAEAIGAALRELRTVHGDTGDDDD